MAQRISILIITYNRPADLLELLQSLATQLHLDKVLEEILILNNASSESYAPVTDYANANPQLKIKYIWSDENTGVAKGRNWLTKIAKGDILLNIDDDMVFTGHSNLESIGRPF